jgi:uncharacterized membrane protein
LIRFLAIGLRDTFALHSWLHSQENSQPTMGKGSILRALLATTAVIAATIGTAWLFHHWPVIVGGIIALVVVLIIIVGALRLVLLAVRSKRRTSNEAAASATTAMPFANVLDTHFRQQTLATSPFLLFEAPVLAPPPPNMVVLSIDDLLPPAILPPTTAMTTTTTRARSSMAMDQPNGYVPSVYTKSFS